MSNRKANKLALDVQAFVSSEIEKRINIAIDNLRTQNEVIGRERSLPVKIAVAAWSFVLIVCGVAAYFLGPDVIKGWVQKSVDAHVTVPEIENAANRVLNEKLDALATEKMLPFEQKANEIHEKVIDARNELERLKQELREYQDLNLARAYDRDAYNRVWARGCNGSDDYSRLCKAVADEVRVRLVEEKETMNFIIMAEPGRRGVTYRGPFSLDEIYERLTAKETMLGAINLVRLDKIKCFNTTLLEIAATSSNLKTSMSAISALEKNGAPSSGFENLSNISNWVANAGLTERQFPIEEYVSAMKKLRTGDIHSAKSDMGKALCILPTLDKLRAAAIVEALARKDIEGADKIYSGFCGSATRWKMVSECYYMSATGGVSRATKQFIECHKKYPTTVYQMARDSYWGLSRWFDETEIVKAIQD